MALADLFDDIAAAIRERDGTTAEIVANTFPARIRGIPPGGIQLSSIAVTTPPDKTKYLVGESFNPAGMVVTAAFDNGATLEVDNSGLTFSPSGALAETDTAITISYTSGTVTATTQISISVSTSTVRIYGATWDGTSTTKWSRTDAAALFTDPVPYVAGATEYSSPFDSLYPWSGMVKSERTGGTMVAIPKFWYKLTQDGSAISIQIADEPVDGFVPSPAHMDRGDGKGERDVVYVGRYHCGDDFKSNTGQSPKVRTTRADFRSSIHALEDTIWQGDFALRFTIWLLYLVEFADWNSQACIGYGCGNGSAAQSMGYTDSMPYHTGTTLSSRGAYGIGTQYRNIEGLWDNCTDFADGCYNSNNGLNIILNPSDFSESGGVSVGTPTNGWASAFNVVNQAGFPMIIPSNPNGVENVASCDIWAFNAANPVVTVGGYYQQIPNYGLFYIGNTSVSTSSAARSSRLMELP